MIAATYCWVAAAAAAGCVLGRRAASSSGSGSSSSSGGSGHTAKERAAGYLRDKERSGSGGGDGSEQPSSRLAAAAAEWDEDQQAMFLSSPGGLGVGAEVAIAQAIKEGALDSLSGKGGAGERWERGRLCICSCLPRLLVTPGLREGAIAGTA